MELAAAPGRFLRRLLVRNRPRPLVPASRLRGWRTMAHSRRPSPREQASSDAHWQQRTDVMPADRSKEYHQYPTVTARELRVRRERPRRVKMLMREFIEDSLYNPHYGYFSKQAVIFTPGEPFDFSSFRDEPAFHRELGARYTEFEDHLDAGSATGPDEVRQLWHTPTELFRPHYGEAVAAYLVSNYRLTTYPYEDLIVYETGAGRGTLMLNILDYIRDADPDVYARTRFRVIEISPALAALQRRLLLGGPHRDRVEIINRSVFDWDEYVPSPCFFLAMEVIDNFAHDCVRYDVSSLPGRGPAPQQASVLIDGEGDFYEFYSPRLDPVAARFFSVRHAAADGRYPTPYLGGPRPSLHDMDYLHGHDPPTAGREWGAKPTMTTTAGSGDHCTLAGRLRARLRDGVCSVQDAIRIAVGALPGSATLSPPEYIPTRLMQFFDVLERYFPAHRLVVSDFHALPGAVEGLNGPVVQTRYRRQTVPVTTPLVHQGYFDILFPTDFFVMEKVYQAMTGKLTRVTTHEEFMVNWAYVEATATQSGENPLLSWYRNASIMVTV